MKFKVTAPSIAGLLLVLALLAGSIGCSLSGTAPAGRSEALETPSPTSALAPTPAEPALTTIEGPDGMLLTLEGEALTAGAEVSLEVLGETDLLVQGSVFDAVGPEYKVSFGGGEQIGGILLTVPLSQTAKVAAPAGEHVYAAFSRPERGSPSMVGVVVEDGRASLPIVGAGQYQILQVLKPSAAAVEPMVWKPLAVPSYPQMSCGWCSTTALTDLAGYHEGAWPSGGYGGMWGESSNWYLGGLAGQPCSAGYFFHWLLGAGGYTAPANVKQSFTNGNAEVIIWNWIGYKIDLDASEFYDAATSDQLSVQLMGYVAARLQFANALFDVFQAYVESNVWGTNGGRRPVAWGSSLASHSRTITGSDGQELFFNNPSSGSLNDHKTWEAYRQEVLASLSAEKTEVIDTAVFYAEARPASERRGVLWLTQWSSTREGSLVLRRGPTLAPAAYWHWDAAGPHDYGYYFEDLVGDLPADPAFDVQFKAMSAKDVVEYGFAVRSISDSGYDFVVRTELFSETGKVTSLDFTDRDALVNAGGRADIYPAGSFQIGDLDPGLYRLKFTLTQGGVVQDVKYLFFRLAPRGYVPQIPSGVLKQPALCRRGPGTAYAVVTGFEPPMRLTLLGVNTERTWGMFEADVSASKVQCWISLNLLELTGEANVPVLADPALPAASPCAQYTTPQTCSQHAECSWNRLVSPAVCQAK